MSSFNTPDVLQQLYTTLGEHIVQQCLQELQTADGIARLNLSEHIRPIVSEELEQSIKPEQTQALEENISITQQMIEVLEGALQDHREEIDALDAENKNLKQQIERLQSQVKRLERENANFQVSINEIRLSVFDRLDEFDKRLS